MLTDEQEQQIAKGALAKGLGTRSIEWATIYQSLGAEGLKTAQKLSTYSAETKRKAVCDYLSEKGSLREIQKKYGIRSDKQLWNWIMKYNGIYKLQLPNITAHVCRHTYCSNMAKSGMNPKTLQYLMGHSDISVTLDTYTHLKFEDAKDEVKRVMKLG